MSIKPRTIFISGTDTDAGKTFVSCGILEAAKLVGFSTAAVKPLAAGGVDLGEGLRNDDALALQQQCSLALSYDQVNPVCFKLPIAPHLAAKQEGRKINATQLSGFCRGVMMKRAGITVIEGAGGWKVPINKREFFADMLRELKVPVILVVAMRLGCINHALLSANAIRSDGIRLAGWIANQVEPEMDAYQDNVETLSELMPAPLLAEISYVDNFSPLSSCAKQLDINRILASVA